MSTSRNWIALLLAATLVVPGIHASEPLNFHDASQIMAKYKQWMVGANSPGPVLVYNARDHRSNYNLKGSVNRKFLHYEKQGTGRGINLGWTSNASASTANKNSKWHFSRQFNAKGPILYGETIAISWGDGKQPYIRYSERHVGINLDWSKRPVYEWTLLGGEPQTPVKGGQDWLVIYNLKHDAPLIHFDRTAGADIGWPDSQTWGLQTVKSVGNAATKTAVVKAMRWGVKKVPTVEVHLKH